MTVVRTSRRVAPYLELCHSLINAAWKEEGRIQYENRCSSGHVMMISSSEVPREDREQAFPPSIEGTLTIRKIVKRNARVCRHPRFRHQRIPPTLGRRRQQNPDHAG